jgi:hypothetical protein
MAVFPKAMYVHLLVQDLLWSPGVKLSKENEELQADFAGFIAQQYRKELVKAIDTQRFKTKWPPLSFEYYTFKKRHHLSTNMWEATGFLKDHIVAFKKKGEWVVGPDPDAIHPESHVSLLFIARCLEYGTDKIPARPLFRPLAAYISRHIDLYWRSFLKLRKSIKKSDRKKTVVLKKKPAILHPGEKK